jgi:hypothetical protein
MTTNQVHQLFGSVCPDMDASIKPCTHFVQGGTCTMPNHFRCLEYIIRKEPPMSFSSISDFKACPRKYLHRWINGWKSKEKGWALILGSHASKILGILHDKQYEEDCIERYNAYINEVITASEDPEDEDCQFGEPSFWVMKCMFDTYVEKGMHSKKGNTEYEFHWDMPEYPKVHGYLDFCNLTTYDDTFGDEFKYTGQADRYDKFAVEEQLSAYFIGVPQLKRMTVTCFVPPNYTPYNSKRKKESINEFIIRCKEEINKHWSAHVVSKTYWREEMDLERYKGEAREIAHMIVKYIETGNDNTFYQNRKECRNMFPCDFIPVCKYGVMDETQFKKREARR